MSIALENEIADHDVYERTVSRFRERRILLPTFSQLAHPETIPSEIQSALAGVKPDEADPLNLFRVHWYNDDNRTGLARLPSHVVLEKELTGVDARIVVLLGDRFPMVRCHKVLASYGCLAPRIITGRFDPTAQRAVWPSTGNYCRGGVAISRLMSCRGVAVLPEGMSRERFAWLEQWVADPADVVTTPGTESNVKEIYDKCAELAADPENVIFNQFAEFGNHLAHYLCTGSALADVFEHMRAAEPTLELSAAVFSSGSSGTLGSADHLKDTYGTKIVAVEALECPTMLCNGFGAHNIQGIGDKHIPLIHNVHNTDLVVAVSDEATDRLSVLFSSKEGLDYLADRQQVGDETLGSLADFGLSSICNIVASIKAAKKLDLGSNDVIVTVATDPADMYESERERIIARDFADGFDPPASAEVFSRFLLGADTDHVLETTHEDRERIFNLGYFTWVEQQGLSLEDFVVRREQSFWRGLRENLPVWDEKIAEFNAATGVSVG